MEGNPNLRSDPHSDFVLGLMYEARKFKILITAINVGVFDDLENIGKGDWVSDRTLAHYRSYDVDNTKRFLNTLAAMKVLDRGSSPNASGEDKAYRNTISTRRYLLRAGQNSLIPLLHAEETLIPLYMKNLPYVLKFGSVEQFPRLLWRGGYPQDDAFLTLPDFAVSARLEYNNNPTHNHSKLQPHIQPGAPGTTDLPLGAKTVCNHQSKSMLQLGRELFIAAWDAQQEQCLAALLEAHNLRGFDTIVELGGGSGRLAWKISQAHPHVHVYVFDSPRIMESMDKPFTIGQNVKYLSGDFFCDLLPEADCYIVSHVLREYDDERVDLLLGRIHDHLNHGGTLLIMEKVLNDTKRAPVNTILDDLLAATISKGRERTEYEFAQLLKRNGLDYLQIKRILGVNTFDVLIAKRPCEPLREKPTGGRKN
ncbi:N,N-dimethyltransferase OxyT-like [Littorina saxatilis]|uniref:Acetylserotonin O-methyltransferase n=1 Tax=Littorina saxatilis TaxID=31220 RepID=A0AAN9BEJ4_9CAEN